MNRLFITAAITVSGLFGCGAAAILVKSAGTDATIAMAAPAASQPAASPSCAPRIIKGRGVKWSDPLLFFQRGCRSNQLSSINNGVTVLIDQAISEGAVVRAGYYLRDLNSSEWCGIKEQEPFLPGSLFKLPFMLTYLRGVAQQRLSLDQLYLVETRNAVLPRPTFLPSQELMDGREYPLHEVLKALIQRSDNKASWTLIQHLDPIAWKAVFQDAGIPAPNDMKKLMSISPAQFTAFWDQLYNSTTLNNELAQLGMGLANGSEFRQGITAGLPNEVRVAHKFGEYTDADGDQLHDSGIVFLEGRPYALTIMTHGTDMARQADLIQRISALVYAGMSRRAPTSGKPAA